MLRMDTMRTPPEIIIFRSKFHPGDTSWHWTFARWYVTPLSMCILPVMIGALMAVLQGYPALIFLTVGAPLGIGLAALWTQMRIYTTLAELHIRPGAVALRTVWESLRDDALRWYPIFELRDSPTTISVAVGDFSQDLPKWAWPQPEAILSSLKAARTATSMTPT